MHLNEAKATLLKMVGGGEHLYLSYSVKTNRDLVSMNTHWWFGRVFCID